MNPRGNQFIGYVRCLVISDLDPRLLGEVGDLSVLLSNSSLFELVGEIE
jgi:hypothetical protein